MKKFIGKLIKTVSKTAKMMFLFGLLWGTLTLPIWGVFFSDRFGFSPYSTFIALTSLLFVMGVGALAISKLIIKNKLSNLPRNPFSFLIGNLRQRLNQLSRNSKSNWFIPLADKPARITKIIIIQDLSLENKEKVSISRQSKRSKKNEQNRSQASR